MDKIDRIKKLVKTLNEASYAYYGKDNPIMSDKEYDDLYDELLQLEQDIGCILAGSPTQKVQGYILKGFKKVKHSKPMLSANKTKNTGDIKKFITGKDFYCSYKLDGLTLVVRYKDGKFIQGITRGNGVEGEDVTEQCKFIKNLPMQIHSKDDIELRGECVISWSEFDRINSTLQEPYSHPRNLAAGTLRNLDLNIVKERNLSFVVFEVVNPIFENKLDGLKAFKELGFTCVGVCKGDIENCIKAMQPEFYPYPVDGLIFELSSYELSKSLGSTSHHESCRMALKWKDDLYETILTDIEWNTSKTGLINPVAVFNPVDLDGAITTRATLHNISYIEKLQLGIGDTIQVYRSNMVIPKVHDNLTRSNTWLFPEKCPCCGGNVEIYNENGSKTLHCTNPDCKAKLIAKLAHAASKNALNIDGLSEATIEKFVNMGWLNSIKDIYYLKNYSKHISMLEGFGKKSALKLLDSIENSRNTDLSKFLYSLSIPLIGKTASKDIAKACEYNIDIFRTTVNLDRYNAFKTIDGFGEEMNDRLVSWWDKNRYEFCELAKEFVFEVPNNNSISVSLSGKTFCITGKLLYYSNRTELINVIENLGGKVTGSISVCLLYTSDAADE